jgi:hypothetical protein
MRRLSRSCLAGILAAAARVGVALMAHKANIDMSSLEEEVGWRPHTMS